MVPDRVPAAGGNPVLVAVFHDCGDRRLVYVFARHPGPRGGHPGTLGVADHGMHPGHFVGNVAMHDGARAIAVVQRGFVPREDIDDHRLAGPQLAVPDVVAIGPDRSAGNDRRQIHVAQVDEPVIDHGPHPLGRQRAAFVQQNTVASGLGPGDQAAGPLDDLFGGLLRLADVLELLGVLATAVGDADRHVTLDADARLAREFGEDQRQRPVGHDPRHAPAAKTFGGRLGRGRLAVAGKALGRREVAGTGHFIGPGKLAGPIHLDIAENKHRLRSAVAGGKLQIGHRIAHEEADTVIKGRIELGDARHEQG